MKINGQEYSIQDLNCIEIGSLLRRKSPDGDGRQLTVVFSAEEERFLVSVWPTRDAGQALRCMLSDAVRSAGREEPRDHKCESRIFVVV